MVELAMASYVSLYPALLLPPLLILCQQRRNNVFFFVNVEVNVDLNSLSDRRFLRCSRCAIITKLPLTRVVGFSRFNIRSHVHGLSFIY
jgi:hypothetical protein